jgi:hypothetical protein
MRRVPGNDLVLGEMPGRNSSLGLSRQERDKHLYVCGSTGTGKSKFLENLIRQDIRNWRKSKCGLIVIDPHGNLYDSLINWLAWTGIERPIIPIDLRQDDWIVAYNVVRQRKADPGVIVDNLTDAMAHVWGQGGTDSTPLFARWIGNVIRTLYEKNLTLIQSEYLVDRVQKRVRSAITAGLKHTASRQDWQFADTLSAKDFEAQIGSTINRLRRFTENQMLRSIFGISDVSLDLGRALDEGSIILVSLATERAKVSKESAELFATLLLNDLWTAAQERGKREGVKPFYVYLDEFQRFVSPTIADNLDQARGFGLHLTMAHQFPNQLLDRGENGRRLYNSIMENASSKVVFRLQHEENLRAMAQWLFMGTMDPDEIKLQLYSRKVMNYREDERTAYASGRSSGTGGGKQSGHAAGSGRGGTNMFDDTGLQTGSSRSWSMFTSGSGSYSDSWADSESTSEITAPMLVPVFGEELSHVQYRSLDEQIFRSMAALFDQQQRQGVARLVGMRTPASIYTPVVSRVPANPVRTQRFLEHCYEKLPFALPSAEAERRIREAAVVFSQILTAQSVDEPTTAKRIIK